MKVSLAFVALLISAPALAQSRGPQPVTCPTEAVLILPGDSIQVAVNANPGVMTFCLRTGTHLLTASITPKTGNTFIGELGAILDGSGWQTSDNTQAAFRAHNQDIDNVTIRNLVIRNMPQKGIYAFKDFSNNWTVENVEIANNHTGVVLGSGAIVRNNLIHHNIRNPLAADPGDRGGGYAFYFADNVMFENNEVSYNGPEQKFMSTRGAVVRGNSVHHNYEGIWFDGNANFVIEFNTVSENRSNGIFHEVSQGAIIRHNAVQRNGGNGIFVSTSRDTQIHGNTLTDNLHGITFFVDCTNGVGWSNYGRNDFLPGDLTNNLVFENSTTVTGQVPNSLAALFSWTQCSVSQLAPYLSNVKRNVYERNRYTIPPGTDGWWNWSGPHSWAQWQALPQDAGSEKVDSGVPSPPPPTSDSVDPRITSLSVKPVGNSAQRRVRVEATDNIGIARIDVLLDGARVAGCTSSPCEVSIRITPGMHVINARAFDAANNESALIPGVQTWR